MQQTKCAALRVKVYSGMKNKSEVLTILKYVFAESMVLFAAIKNSNVGVLFVASLELIIIFSLFNISCDKISKTMILLGNDLVLLLFNIQMVVLAFSNSLITMMMLTSFRSIEDIGGKKAIYITGLLVVFGISLIPISKVRWINKRETNLIIFALFMLLFSCFRFGFGYSPFFGYSSLVDQEFQNILVMKDVRNSKAVGRDFHKNEIEDSYGASFQRRNSSMPDKPNVILVMAEGLSQNIIDDERGIMRHIKSMQDNSLSFRGYYNHTFATYRGLIGQLSSGYQLSDLDTNTLTSMQSVFSGEGYDTVFINTEPKNDDFILYLNGLGFNKVINDDSKLSGFVNSISDKDAFKLLYNTAIEYNQKDTPFFITIYTFGTHTSFDSPDKVFEDGEDAVLNRFYNLDYQFSKFMKKYKKSELVDNTIIIFTTDHATYQDDSFNQAFPDYKRIHTEVDEIPLFIYHNNVITGHIDVGGRNSLDLAPTVFDFLDISAPNSFLGSSLFAEEAENEWEYCFTDSTEKYSTRNKNITKLEGDNLKEFETLLREYYATVRLADK